MIRLISKEGDTFLFQENLKLLSGLVADILESEEEHGSGDREPIVTNIPASHLQRVKEYCQLIHYDVRAPLEKPPLQPLQHYFSKEEILFVQKLAVNNLTLHIDHAAQYLNMQQLVELICTFEAHKLRRKWEPVMVDLVNSEGIDIPLSQKELEEGMEEYQDLLDLKGEYAEVIKNYVKLKENI